MDSAGEKEGFPRNEKGLKTGSAGQRGPCTEKKLEVIKKNQCTLPCSGPSGPRSAGPPAAKQQ